MHREVMLGQMPYAEPYEGIADAYRVAAADRRHGWRRRLSFLDRARWCELQAAVLPRLADWGKNG